MYWLRQYWNILFQCSLRFFKITLAIFPLRIIDSLLLFLGAPYCYEAFCSLNILKEFSGLHYCLFVKVLFFLLEVFPEELSFLSLRQLIEFIISSSVCQELFSFYFQVSFETWLLITRSNSSVVYQNSLFVSSSFFIFFRRWSPPSSR